jgi:hypothetical protein
VKNPKLIDFFEAQFDQKWTARGFLEWLNILNKDF